MPLILAKGPGIHMKASRAHCERHNQYGYIELDRIGTEIKLFILLSDFT